MVWQAWLLEEVAVRWTRLHKAEERVKLGEVRTIDNVRLDMHDTVGQALLEGETVICIIQQEEAETIGCGDVLGNNYLMSIIGEGTFGRVYQAHDLNLNRNVAVKVLRKEKANKVNTRRFMREAELNGVLSKSPYVVTVHDFGRSPLGSLYLVMELLEGEPLDCELDRRIDAQQPFAVMDVIHLALPILRGLQVSSKGCVGLPAFFCFSQQTENSNVC